MIKTKNRRIVVALLLTVSMMVLMGSTLSAFAGTTEGTAKERKIVVFKKDVSFSEKENVLKKHGAVKLKDLYGINGVVVNLEKNNMLVYEEGIAYIEDDTIISVSKKKPNPTVTPIPTITPEPTPEPEVIPWGIEYMEAPLYWGQVDTDNIKIGVIDSGIDMDHPDLKDNIKGGYNVFKKNKAPEDDNGHGTHVAGIIAATKNEFGVVGMVPDADLYAIKVLDSAGDGYVSDIIEGIEWAISNNMNILNMSFGTITDSQSLHDVVINAYNAGITMVAAAGNNYGGVSEYPAAYPEVISVGAIDKDGSIAAFSALEGVDIYAPGVIIYSTYLNGEYQLNNGTSMACPHIVGKIIIDSLRP